MVKIIIPHSSSSSTNNKISTTTFILLLLLLFVSFCPEKTLDRVSPIYPLPPCSILYLSLSLPFSLVFSFIPFSRSSSPLKFRSWCSIDFMGIHTFYDQ